MAEASKKDISDKNLALEKRIKKHVIGKPHRFIAVAPLGFEETLAEELKYIGIECSSNISSSGSADATIAAGIKVAGDGKVEFTAKITEAWKAVAYSRIANRVLMEIGSFKAENFGQLEKGVAGVPWELFLPSDCLGENGAGLVLHTSCKHSRLYHSDAVEERVRKVIGAIPMSSDVIPAQAGIPSPSQHLYVTLIDDRCTLWLDLAGEELYKRGHERFVAEAPLKETIAAAMIFEASRFAQPPAIIVDPMAGSGTFSLETAYIANGLIPGKCRDFALMHQPAFKEGTWNFILKGSSNVIASEAKQSKQSSPTLKIITSDISERPVSIIKHNVECSPLAEIAQSNPDAATINPQLKDFFSYSAQDIPDGAIILQNPPYGKRLAFDAPKLYTKIGLKLNEFKGAVIAILAPKDCTENLLKACPALDPHHNDTVKTIETSHGGFSLNAIFAKI